ncbi:hypothetical protein LTR53_018285, partial [Teratosphaeriaceae sp. CCFEE 6253]
MAAAGFDQRPSGGASSLQTPASGGFPSELRSPLAGSPGFQKQREADLKTPITPPLAYLDFLKSMSPAMPSPAPTGTSARFSFHADTRAERASSDTTEKPSISPPASQPALSRNTSYDSTASTASAGSSTASSAISAHTATTSSLRRPRPDSPRVTIPQSPFAMPAPRSSRTPRKLHIPHSPFSAGMPSAALSSSYSSTPLSAAPWSASYSPPREVDTETSAGNGNGKPGKVTVKQVVTRTVTYCRTPLEAVPDGKLWKRRKIEHEGEEEGTSKESSAEPRVKEETPDE